MKRWIAPLRASFPLGSGALAKRYAGVTLPETVDVDGTRLRLNGVGLREATILRIGVYVAGLYLEQPSADARSIIEQERRKQVRLALLRDVPRADLIEQLHLSFRRAAGPELGRLEASFQLVAAWLPELRKNDTFSVTYRPSGGLEVSHGARVLGTVPGPDFARVIFAIWLGDTPPNPGLKSGLLGIGAD
jgi:hypothetical protein